MVLLLLGAVQYLIGIVPIWFWIPGIMVALGIIYGTLVDLAWVVMPAALPDHWHEMKARQDFDAI